MQKRKTHFEQIPIELVKKIAEEDVLDDAADETESVPLDGNRNRAGYGRKSESSPNSSQPWKSD
jgi:hypothetical protein